MVSEEEVQHEEVQPQTIESSLQDLPSRTPMFSCGFERTHKHPSVYRACHEHTSVPPEHRVGNLDAEDSLIRMVSMAGKGWHR